MFNPSLRQPQQFRPNQNQTGPQQHQQRHQQQANQHQGGGGRRGGPLVLRVNSQELDELAAEALGLHKSATRPLESAVIAKLKKAVASTDDGRRGYRKGVGAEALTSKDVERQQRHLKAVEKKPEANQEHDATANKKEENEDHGGESDAARAAPPVDQVQSPPQVRFGPGGKPMLKYFTNKKQRNTAPAAKRFHDDQDAAFEPAYGSPHLQQLEQQHLRERRQQAQNGTYDDDEDSDDATRKGSSVKKRRQSLL